jgi:hypothetical protein
VKPALQSDIQLTHEARDRFVSLGQEEELAEHPGLKIEIDEMIVQEEFLAATVQELQEDVQSAADVPSEPAPEPEARPESEQTEPPSASPLGRFTVGSLIDQEE